MLRAIHEKYGDKRLFPSFEEGRLRHTNKCHATFDMAQPGRSDHPGRADDNVALHLVDRRAHPSSKEGEKRLFP